MRRQGLALAVALTLGLGPFVMGGQAQQADVPLPTLTVPAEVLGRACRLRAAPDSRNRVVEVEHRRTIERAGSLWLVQDNPWAGSERRVLVQLREAIEGSYPTPDAPPLTPTERARLDEQFGAPVAAGYQALYEEGSRIVAHVRAIRFHEAARARTSPAWMRRGGTVVRVGGDTTTDCFRIVETYVRARMAGSRMP